MSEKYISVAMPELPEQLEMAKKGANETIFKDFTEKELAVFQILEMQNLGNELRQLHFEIKQLREQLPTKEYWESMRNIMKGLAMRAI